jgi:hypothetical protein
LRWGEGGTEKGIAEDLNTSLPVVSARFYCYSVPKKIAKLPLSKTHPKLAKEADGWDPKTIDSSSGKEVNWKCSLGHTWSTKLSYRVVRDSDCPYCVNQKVWIGFNDFATTHPHMLKELISSDGTDFVAGSTSKSCTWKCSLGHIYNSKPQNRTVRMQGCPICSGRQVLSGFNDLSTTHPQIASEAYNFDPKTLSAGSNVDVEWKCSIGHIFNASPHQRTGRKSGCAVCHGNQVMKGVNDIATTYPDLAAQAYGWDTTAFTGGHNKKLNWICSYGHIWPASPNSRTNMESGCPICDGRKLLTGFNDLKTLFPEVARQAKGWDPSLVLAGTHSKRSWICEFGHNWISVVKDRTSRGDGCPSCTKFGFDNNKKAWIYFLRHDLWGLLQIGITNNLNNRLNDHKKLGWEVIEISNSMEGIMAKSWEKSILDFINKSGVKLGDPKIAGTYSGYTETWRENDFPVKSIKELMRLTEEFEELR